MGHHQSRSVNVQSALKHKHSKPKLKQAESVEAVDYVPIVHAKSSPTLSDSRTLLDHLNEIELDVETPSDEESLIFIKEDDLKSNDSDIDDAEYWNMKRDKAKHMNDIEESADEDISLLSAQKGPGIDDEDLGDSDYSDREDEINKNEYSDSDNDRSSSNDIDDENLSKAERKRRRKQRRKKKK